MKITDQQFESILLRLESGEDLESVQADFPALEDDIAALQDLQDFFAAQRLVQKPDPAGLRSVVRQVKLLESTRNDDEFSWGSFFTSFRRPLTVAMPAFALLAVSGYMWQSQIVPLEVALDPAPINRLVAQDSRAGETPMDMAALAESLSAEFALDMQEFETTRNELEPFYEEQLFSYVDTTTL